MKKWAPIIAGIILGLLFIMASAMVLFKLAPIPEIPKDTPPGQFMAAFGPTGYMTFIKVLEMVGGILVAIPKSRNIGLLILGPIIVNILAYHTFVLGGVGLNSPMILGIAALALFLMWAERKAWAGLWNRVS
ncbi:hypothetical protein [Luteolibacter luteus]|uniref:DoxX family protein n=1 Tax=Luteolibacter luteus TaxID=2728835 RepID=A0A858RLU6_9BACT|nr:hypothetical protein [Luteolibacter luteus]QJE97937.1 hypothetical protein HHL09_19815 [Luteolibacter luteus]